MRDLSAATPFAFGNKLTDYTTIYAKWTPNTSANYTVLVWKENLNLDGYDFAEAVNLTGTVNTVVNSISQQGSGDNAYARINNTDYRYEGFHLKSFDQNVVIKTEGSSVVNVYYDRTEYTLTFQVESGGWPSSWNPVKTITAKYGTSIIDQFPIKGDNGTDYTYYDYAPYRSMTTLIIIFF